MAVAVKAQAGPKPSFDAGTPAPRFDTGGGMGHLIFMRGHLMAHSGASTLFTFDPASDDYPAWSPDGKYIACSSKRGGHPAGTAVRTMDLYIKPADGSGERALLLKQMSRSPWSISPRMASSCFTSVGPKTAADMWSLPYPGAAKPVSLLRTQFDEGLAMVSPDGRWVAYASSESGPSEV
jgi:Tol biopolymer transport system component